MKYFLILCGLSLILSNCNTKQETADVKNVREEVIKTDLAFSKLSEDSGYQKAFIAYADENMIRLNPRHYATIGRKQLIEEFQKDSSASISLLEWAPLHVEVASSGDMASAFGDWNMQIKLPSNKDTTLHGNYITIWKKQADGTWKFILDGGNPTPGPTDPKLLDKIKTE